MAVVSSCTLQAAAWIWDDAPRVNAELQTNPA